MLNIYSKNIYYILWINIQERLSITSITNQSTICISIIEISIMFFYKFKMKKQPT